MWLAGAKTRARPTYQLLVHGCGLQIGCSRRTSNASYRFQIGPDGALGFQATGAESATGGSPSTTSTVAVASKSSPSAGGGLSCSPSPRRRVRPWGLTVGNVHNGSRLKILSIGGKDSLRLQFRGSRVCPSGLTVGNGHTGSCRKILSIGGEDSLLLPFPRGGGP